MEPFKALFALWEHRETGWNNRLFIDALLWMARSGGRWCDPPGVLMSNGVIILGILEDVIAHSR